MLGGNTSSEVRVHACGADQAGGNAHGREGAIIEEIRLEESVQNPQPETVRDHRVEVESEGTWQEVAAVTGNYQRRRVHGFQGRQVTALRVTCEATNGGEQARISEVRAYE